MALLSEQDRQTVRTHFAGITHRVTVLLFTQTIGAPETAIIALTLYTLQILYRNIIAGLANVPGASKDAGRGMGMTDGQLLWRIELPLALPEIIAGLRIATVSTVAIATLAVFAGAGGLGAELYDDITFKTGIVVCGGIAIAMAIVWAGLRGPFPAPAAEVPEGFTAREVARESAPAAGA